SLLVLFEPQTLQPVAICQHRVARLTATRGAGLGLPRRNRCFREPHGQAPALAQRDVIGSPIRHSVPLLRDVMTAILVHFEWHGDCPGSGAGPPSYTLNSPPNDRAAQQGRLRTPPMAKNVNSCNIA